MTLPSMPQTPAMAVGAGFVRMAEALVSVGEVSKEDFNKMRLGFEAYQKYRASHPNAGWPPVSPVGFVESLWTHLGPQAFFRAWAAWHDQKFQGIRELCGAVVPQFGAEYFAGRSIETEISAGLPIGETLVKMGILQPAQIDAALVTQTEIRDEIGIQLLLGILLVARHGLTLGEYYQALAIHFALPFSGLDDDTANAIRTAFAAKHGK